MSSSGLGERGAEAPLNGLVLFGLSICISILMTAAAWYVSGGPELIGIDDAAITRNYAENIANGHGFVYYVGGERVEGATSFLWTLLVALAYLLTPDPEMLVIALAVALTSVAVFAALSFGALAARGLGLSQRLVVGLSVIAMAGLPAYFFWTGLTMMEVALWSATLLVLSWRLAKLVERPKAFDPLIVVAAATLPLIRPEGAAAGLGLLVLSIILMRRAPRGVLIAIGATLLSTVAIVGFRLAYFGYPAPNTFYAKVSSDRVQDLIDGVKYLFSFVTGHPFAEVLLGVWALLAVWAAIRFFSPDRRGAPALLIGAATVAGVFAIYGGLGGDYFAYWRFLEPVVPLLGVGAAIGVAALWTAMGRRALGVDRIIAGVAVLIWLGVSFGDYRQNRFLLAREIVLVEQGLAFGALMNEIDEDAVIGVVPAGGVALGYDGPILDLLGLNWVEMAHANPVKTGVRNHASFDAETFWRHAPDLLPEFNHVCAKDMFRVSGGAIAVIKGLHLEPRFQAAYRPVRIHDGDICWRGFARSDWVESNADPRLEIVPWAEVELLP